MTIVLTSKLDLYDYNDAGEKVAKNFGNINGIYDNLKKYIKKYENFLFIASNENDPVNIDPYAHIVFESFRMTLPFQQYEMLDYRTEENATDLIQNADFIFISGGHLPTQNKFFKKIHLEKLIQKATGVICGGSAGSMSCADTIYCPPELEGESNDIHFQKKLRGLGITNINILPHYNVFKDYTLDGKRYMEDIIYPDSNAFDIVAIPDNSYILVDKDVEFYGEAYLIQKGTIINIDTSNYRRTCFKNKQSLGED